MIPSLRLENFYAYEIPDKLSTSQGFPIKEIMPILGITYNNFRKESDFANAIILSDVFVNLEIENVTLIDLLMGKENHPLEAIRWQNEYTSGIGRRRYKPISEGFTLKIKKDILLKYLLKTELVLCYNFLMKRSASVFSPESYMQWHTLQKRFELDVK